MSRPAIPDAREPRGTPPMGVVLALDGGPSKPAPEDADTDAGAGIGLRPLLWAEWFSHSKLLLLFLCSWLLVFWAVPLVVHPLWILAFAVVYALVMGPAIGGADVIHGCEEFMLALPPARRQRFRARWILGLGGILLFTFLDLAALGLNLSDVLARLFLSAGLIEPLQLSQPGLLYGLVGAFPAAIFAFGFAMASLARSRTVAITAWLWGTLFALGTLRIGLELEEWRWDEFNGRIVTPLLVVATAGVLGLAEKLYGLKEAGAEAPPLKIPLSWWVWMLALLLAALGVAALLGWFATTFGKLV